MNCSDDEAHGIAAKVTEMVMEVKAKKSAAPNDGFPVASPFDDPNGPRDPCNFFKNVAADMIPVALSGWALTAEFDNLRSRLAKYVDEVNPRASEDGLGLDDAEGYTRIDVDKASEQSKKRKASADAPSGGMLDAIKSSGNELASAVRALAGGLAAQPAVAPQGLLELRTAELAAARAEHERLVKLRGVLMVELKGMFSTEGKEIFSDEDRDKLKTDHKQIGAKADASLAEVERLEKAVQELG